MTSVPLTYQFCDDWLIFARDADGGWWSTNTETWPAWLDVTGWVLGREPTDEEVAELTEMEDAVAECMVPLVTAWNAALSPTAEVVSGPAGLRWERWERVPDEFVADLEARRSGGPR